ncbi:MAG: hypothetical protein U0X91_16910 [Spirosomataceae bacterium]
MKRLFCFFSLLVSAFAQAQTSPLYTHLPVGKYPVGFKIVTFTDESRVIKPEFNYLGEKNEGDRYKKVTIHLWYPAKAHTGKNTLTYGDYCYNDLLTSSSEVIPPDRKNNKLTGSKSSVERWFGKPTEEAWKQLIDTPMLAQMEATPVNNKFPLLIGTLRPLSTSITNEVLASNGYVVAMVKDSDADSFAEGALSDIPDMQQAIAYLVKNTSADAAKIGVFGFSGSGFSPVLFSMNDSRIKAVADIESGIYMEGLFQNFSASNFYNPRKLRIPFLHIFSRDLSKQEKYIDEFEKKTAFSKRYRLLLNQPKLHHWDFAAEGYTSCLVLKNRGEAQRLIQQSFELANLYLLHFFNAELKGEGQSQAFLATKTALPTVQSNLWDITLLTPVKPAPTLTELEYIIGKKGIQEALNIANATLKNDSASNLYVGYMVNGLGYSFLHKHQYEEAIGIFKLNTELHPEDPNFFDSLAEGYEGKGDTENVKRVSNLVLALLLKKTTLNDSEKALKENAEKRLNRKTGQ